MSFNFKELIRNTLVNDVTLRTELGATATGSANVAPFFTEVISGVFRSYPRITYREIGGGTLPGLDSERGILELRVLVKATGTTSPVVKMERIRDRLIAILDDTFITGTAYTYLMLKESEIEDYEQEERIHFKIMNFAYTIEQA